MVKNMLSIAHFFITLREQLRGMNSRTTNLPMKIILMIAAAIPTILQISQNRIRKKHQTGLSSAASVHQMKEKHILKLTANRSPFMEHR